MLVENAVKADCAVPKQYPEISLISTSFFNSNFKIYFSVDVVPLVKWVNDPILIPLGKWSSGKDVKCPFC